MKMNKYKTPLALALLLAVTFCTGCSNIKSLGRVNGVELTRVTTRGVFSPCTTTVLAHSPEVPGQVEVLVNATGPGLVPACATAGGVAGGAALLRPARTTVNNDGGNASANSSASGSGSSTTTGGSGWIPPGHR